MTRGQDHDIRPLGDRALRVRGPRAGALAARLAAHPPDWLRDQAPALGVLVVYLRPEAGLLEAARDLRRQLDGLPEASDVPPREHHIPVEYGGPDLDEVARRAGLGPDELVRRHAGALYRVAFLGFSPGFAFLTGTPTELQLPRRVTPRLRVPAGSLALGGPWSGVYPFAGPGGWHVIGHTDLRLFDPHRASPALLAPGDRVRFRPQ